MQDRSQDQAFAPLDFEALYQGKQPMTGVDFDGAPWDIGEPQPAIVTLEQSGLLRSDILDAGCGLGEHAVFLAERGYRVTGVDFAPTAIAQAGERARARGVDPEFILADATRLDGLGQRFRTVLDSGLYHNLSDEARTRYAATLHRVTQPAARLHLFCFSDTDSAGLRLPIQVGQDDLRTHLGGHWDIRSIKPTLYTTTFRRDVLEQRGSNSLGPADIDFDKLRTDENGRITIPVWHLHAVRKDHTNAVTAHAS